MNQKILQNDFEFVCEIASDFFSRKPIRKTLKFLNEEDISDWEKWMQIEFAKFCRLNEKISIHDREIRYSLDRRTSHSQQVCCVDFIVTEGRKRSPLGLEFKQNKSAHACIKSMCNDVKKTWKIKSSNDDLRSLWFIGVHEAHPAMEISELIDMVAEQESIVLDTRHIFHAPIGRTGFHMSIF